MYAHDYKADAISRAQPRYIYTKRNVYTGHGFDAICSCFVYTGHGFGVACLMLVSLRHT